MQLQDHGQTQIGRCLLLGHLVEDEPGLPFRDRDHVSVLLTLFLHLVPMWVDPRLRQLPCEGLVIVLLELPKRARVLNVLEVGQTSLRCALQVVQAHLHQLKSKICHMHIKGNASLHHEWVLNVKERGQNHHNRITTIFTLSQLLEVLWVAHLVEAIDFVVQIFRFDLFGKRGQDRLGILDSFIVVAV